MLYLMLLFQGLLLGIQMPRETSPKRPSFPSGALVKQRRSTKRNITETATPYALIGIP